MCQQERVSLQRGMNFRLRGDTSVILMSKRAGAPYADAVEDDGRCSYTKDMMYQRKEMARIPRM
jgi:hypothetical protein